MLLWVIYLFICQVRVGDSSVQGYVVGGIYPKLQTFPHSAFLSVSCQGNDLVGIRREWYCGASIIHKLAMLTAAHCLDGCVSTQIVAAASNAPDRRFTYPAKDAQIHSAYNLETFENDIAIIELKNGVIFSDVIQPAVLKPQLRFSVPEGYLAGWGFVNITERRAGTELKQTRLEVYSRALCTELLGGLPAADFCAGNNYVDHHAATESGSSLVAHSEEGDINIGIVTYHMPKITKAVHVFTFLPMYHKWIFDKLSNIREEVPGVLPSSDNEVPSIVIKIH